MTFYGLKDLFVHYHIPPTIVNILCPERIDVLVLGVVPASINTLLFLFPIPTSFYNALEEKSSSQCHETSPKAVRASELSEKAIALPQTEQTFILPATIFLTRFSTAIPGLGALWIISDNTQYSLHGPATNHKAGCSNLWVIINPCYNRCCTRITSYQEKTKEYNPIL